ncbi:MAG: ABC transporter permease [Gemmatimonadota bacterium]|jgi:predicted permease
MIGLKSAFRTLLKTPFVSGVAILSLALGIGANAAIFSLLEEMLIRPLPVPEPERLVNLEAPGPKPGSQSNNTAGTVEAVFSYPMFRDLESSQSSLTGIAAHCSFAANLSFAGQTRNGRGMLVSGSYFPVLEVQPAAGRLFDPSDDQTPGAHFVAVLSHEYWERQLGSDPGVLNSTIQVNGQPLTILGIAPEGFRGTTLGIQPDVYVPITMREVMMPGWNPLENRRAYWVYLFGKLNREVALEQARAELNTLYRGLITEVEAPLQSGMSDQTMERFLAKQITVEAEPRGQSQLHTEARTPLILLISITAVVLLIACANIANLLLARGANRGPEMAMRASLGAGRKRLLGQLLTESFLLAGLGGIASLFVASWTLRFIQSILPPETQATISGGLSPQVMVFTGCVALATGIVFGLYPAFHSTRPDLVTVLKGSSGQPGGSKSAKRFRSSLVTAQITLSMALLVSAGLFIKSLNNVSRIDLGLSPENIVTFAISPELNGYEFDRAKDLFVQAEAELAAIPGVNAVSTAIVPLLDGSNWGQSVSVEGFEAGPDTDVNSRTNKIGPGFFRLLGTSILAGREFTEGDVGEEATVAVINEAFARKFGLDPRSAVGKRMAIGGLRDDLDIEIVGLVEDAKYSEVKDEVPPLFYTAYRQETGIGAMTFYLKAGVDPAPVMQGIRDVVAGLDPNLPVEDLKTLETQVRENIFLDRMISTLSSSFAALATILAAIGLYGVLSYSVAQRTREIGLRMALGAAGGTVRGMILRQVAWMMAVGGAIGILAAFGLGRGARSLLFEMEGFDPVVVFLGALILTVVALGAGYLPALRASKVDPMKALRYE